MRYNDSFTYLVEMQACSRNNSALIPVPQIRCVHSCCHWQIQSLSPEIFTNVGSIYQTIRLHIPEIFLTPVQKPQTWNTAKYVTLKESDHRLAVKAPASSTQSCFGKLRPTWQSTSYILTCRHKQTPQSARMSVADRLQKDLISPCYVNKIPDAVRNFTEVMSVLPHN